MVVSLAPTKPVILVSGNPLVPEDSIALRIMTKLQKRFPNAEFREFDSAENLEDAGRGLIIVDAAKGIEHVTLLEGVDNRIRYVRQGPDGAIYLLTDEDAGRLLRLTPKK